MKTWWNYVYLIVIAMALPLFAGLLPTWEYKGKYFGGGIAREYAINFVAEYLPNEKATLLIEKFMSGTTSTEIMLYLPIAINVSAVALIIVYCVGTILITVNNLITNSIYQSKRQKAKGA